MKEDATDSQSIFHAPWYQSSVKIARRLTMREPEIAATATTKTRRRWNNDRANALLFALCFAHLSEFDPQYFSYKVCALLFCRLLYCSSPLSISNSTVITAGMSVLVNDNRRIGW